MPTWGISRLQPALGMQRDAECDARHWALAFGICYERNTLNGHHLADPT